TGAFMQPAIRDNNRMAEFTGKSVMSVYEFSICDNAAAYTRAERDHDKVSHALSSAVDHFADCGCVRIIGKGYRNAGFIFHQFCERYDAFPGKIGSVFNSACVII